MLQRETSVLIDHLLTQSEFSRTIYDGIYKYLRDGGLQQEKEVSYILPRLLFRAFGSSDSQ